MKSSESASRRRQKLAFIGVFAGLASLLGASASPVNGKPATIVYAASSVPIYAASGRQQVGMITPGTPLTTSGSAANGFQPVTITAWSQQGDSTTIVAAKGQRIVLATLVAGTHVKIVTTAKDAYGNAWSEVELSGTVPASALTSNQEGVWEQARSLYNTRCSACHALHKPTEFTANQWPTILKTMQKNAALQPAQAALITQFLQTHSK